MRNMLLILFIFISNSLLSQKIISYKYDKEHEGTGMFGGRMVGSVITDYTKSVPTIFIFNLSKKTIKINNKIWGIDKRDEYHYEHDKIVNGVLYMDDKTHFMITIMPKFEGDVQNPQILIKYQNGSIYRYYVKSSQWKIPIDTNSQIKTDSEN